MWYCSLCSVRPLQLFFYTFLGSVYRLGVGSAAAWWGRPSPACWPPSSPAPAAVTGATPSCTAQGCTGWQVLVRDFRPRAALHPRAAGGNPGDQVERHTAPHCAILHCTVVCSLSSLLCAASPGLGRLPTNTFQVVSGRNPAVRCGPGLDLQLWREAGRGRGAQCDTRPSPCQVHCELTHTVLFYRVVVINVQIIIVDLFVFILSRLFVCSTLTAEFDWQDCRCTAAGPVCSSRRVFSCTNLVRQFGLAAVRQDNNCHHRCVIL